MRITLTLNTVERDALWELAARERRDPRDQAALIVVRELERERLAAASEADQPGRAELADAHAR